MTYIKYHPPKNPGDIPYHQTSGDTWIGLQREPFIRRNRFSHGDEGKMELTLRQVANGWLVRAGCYELIFSTSDLEKEIVRFLRDPQAVYGEYQSKYTQTEGIESKLYMGIETGEDSAKQPQRAAQIRKSSTR